MRKHPKRRGTYRVCVIDERPAIRAGLAIVLKGSAFQVVGEGERMADLAGLVSRHRPHLCIVEDDLFLHAPHHGTFKRRNGHHHASPLVVLYVDVPERRHLFEDIACGAAGHVLSIWSRDSWVKGLTILMEEGVSLPRASVNAAFSKGFFVDERVRHDPRRPAIKRDL